ncbi:MAG TPA: FGGY-family carbohydrate kinase, partial [Streptosporangiaceae bacterium]|nr:FGGY-family carbohydrate kinase [Streptosporangiaceae bacterium]
VLLIGGAARNQAVREIAPAVFGRPVAVPPAGEYVADGAARQAAWALTGRPAAWSMAGADVYQSRADPSVRARYAEARDHVLEHM